MSLLQAVGQYPFVFTTDTVLNAMDEQGSQTYYSHYRPKRSCGQGNIFTPVCNSVHRGVCQREPPRPGRPPTPQPPPPRPGRSPPPPGKRTAAYGQ